MMLLRTAVFYLALVPLTLYHGAVAVLASKRGNHGRADQAGQRWARTLLTIAGVEVEVTGLENVPHGTGLVIVSNHLSNLDALVQFDSLKTLSMRFMAKTELYKIPIFRTVLKSMNMVRVDRQAGPAGVAELKARLKNLFENGHSLAVYPEGTRSRAGGLLTFKKGPFVTAYSGNAAVLPITMFGTDRSWKPGDWKIRSGTVQIVVHPPLHADADAVDPVDDLRQRTQSTIETTYRALSTAASD
ncbi:MAG: 1-acyl-sn-glycerol-3-phosphate acyltransferase [Acidimicrobiia bacterium]|nr:1-acyl-sn-glycerol-3-phosphate acyltransferase [Acidimicrobiia bacterium]